MPTTSLPESAPRTLRIRGPRLAGAALATALVPWTLSACGMLDNRTNHGAAPVEITATDAGSAVAPPAGSPTRPGGTPPPGTPQTTTQVVVSGGQTVTRTGYVFRTNVQTKTQLEMMTQTQMATQIRVTTAPPVTSTVTQTATQTVTDTSTVTKTATTTATVKVTCVGNPPVCPA
ncbi:MAG TPA: hypothetical protein VI248_02480 [Kineosporiaceae bacterium]